MLRLLAALVCFLRMRLLQGADDRKPSPSTVFANSLSSKYSFSRVPHEPKNVLATMLLACAQTSALFRSTSRSKISNLQTPRMVGIDKNTLGLDSALMVRLKENGVANLNPLQEAALSHSLVGKDMVVHAETGSGKTLCFALTLLSRLPLSNRKKMEGLVVAPTLELSAQIARVLNALRPGCAVSLRGGEEVLPESQIIVGPSGLLMGLLVDRRKDREANLTPHRGGHKNPQDASQHAKTPPSENLNRTLIQDLRILVLDEVDELFMTLGKYSTASEKEKHKKHPKAAELLLTQICKLTKKEPIQVLATSATVGRPLRRKLANVCERSFEIVNIPDIPGTSADLTHATSASFGETKKIARKVVLPRSLNVEIETTSNRDNYIAAIHDIIDREKASSTLIFIPSGHGSITAVEFLRLCDLDVESLEEALHNQTAIVARTPSEDGPRHRRKIIVASRSVARGLDLHDIELVIIMDAPESSDEFLHLAGRTARQGKNGRVVILTTPMVADRRLASIASHLHVDLQHLPKHHLEERNERWANMWNVYMKRSENLQKELVPNSPPKRPAHHSSQKKDHSSQKKDRLSAKARRRIK